jgi:hypothetical protein
MSKAIGVEIRHDETMRQLKAIAGSQWPFALAKGTTQLAKQGQEAARVRTREEFDLHGNFIPGGIGIKPGKKADVKSIGIARAAVLTKPGISGFMPIHERGGERTPHAGSGKDKGKAIAIPGRDLKSRSYKTGTGKTRKRWKPAELLKDYRKRTSGSKVVRVSRGGRKGKPFIIRGQHSGVPMIVRRRSKAQYPLELLYIFSERATYEPTWKFEDVVKETVSGRYQIVIGQAVADALAASK